MQSRVKICGLNEYHVSKIQESSNNRLVDLGKSLVAMLDNIPDYDSNKAASISIKARISGVSDSKVASASRE